MQISTATVRTIPALEDLPPRGNLSTPGFLPLGRFVCVTDERRSITFVYMNVDDVESVTTELDHGLEIMRQFNLKYIVQMCSPQLLQLRRECGFKMVKMRKPDLMESMILQLYAQTPI